MEDYKKKYEELKKKAETLHKMASETSHDNTRMTIEELFPELRESEDERIRKELIRAFTVTADKRGHEIYGNGITYGQVLDWLEKQGKQKQYLELNAEQKSSICWIKCSDELPNRDGTYLVVTDGRHNDVYDMAKYDSIEGWHKASEIIYWMPIPQLNNKSIIEQKPAWSEEDERMLDRLIKHFDWKNSYSFDKKDCYEAQDWLKSLKERYTARKD